MPENSISEAKQEIEESCAAPPEINAIAITEKKIKKARPKKPRDEILESKPRRSVQQDDREQFMPFLIIWNRSAPRHWDRYDELTVSMIDDLKKFTKSHKSESLEVFEEGLLELSSDPFHGIAKSGKWKFCSYFTNNKPKKWSDEYKGKHRHQSAETPSGEPMTETDRKHQEAYLKGKAAFAKAQQEKAA